VIKPGLAPPDIAIDAPRIIRAERHRSAPARAWWTVAGLTILFWGFQLFGYVDAHPWLILLVFGLGLWGFGIIAVSWTDRVLASRHFEYLGWCTLGVAVIAFLVWSYIQVTVAPAYGTDEVAFDQYAAHLFVHGINPYTHSMGPAFSLFHVSPNGYTFGLNGSPITALSYPSLSFLPYVPFLALGWTTQTAITINVAAWGLGMVLAYALLPRSIRPLAIVVGSLSVYIGYAVGGVTDALFVPLLIGAVVKWDRFPVLRGPVAWRGPVLLGLAMAVKQTPFLVLPFLAVGIGLEVRNLTSSTAAAWKTSGRYVAIAVGTFLIPNLYFIAISPHQWLSGVLTPINAQAVPAGQGLIGLSLFLGIGGGSLLAYSVCVVVVFVALLSIFAVSYPTLKRWAVVLPAFALLFASRSFGSYQVMLLPAALVGAFTVSDGSRRYSRQLDRRRRQIRRWVIPIAAVTTAASIAVALLVPPPFTVVVTSVRTTGQLATVVEVGVKVTNHTGRPLHPAFSVESGGSISAFWSGSSGPRRIPAHATARYELQAPNFFAQPPITGGFQVVAYTSAPGSVSSSAPYNPTVWHVSLEPDAVNHPVKVGHTYVLKAEVLDKLDRLVHVTDQPIYLGQVTYAQQGLLFSQAVVNRGQVGQTPVIAYTSGGIATFVIRGTKASINPVYFEANLVNGRLSYPYGYSQIVPIRFDS
jgi:uncharacterized membrane protein